VTKVSVIIPTYNRASTVPDAVRSALNQTYASIEVIVVDDGSTDDTAARLLSFSSQITFLSQKNAGPSLARNHGARHASGDILAFLDSDDVWKPDKIRRQVELMATYGKSMICCVCNAEILDQAKVINPDAFGIAGVNSQYEESIWQNPGEVLASRFLLFNQVAAIRRDAFVKVGGYNSRINLLEDHDLALKLASVGGVWGLITAPLVIKSNETKGIGVECGKNPLQHARVQRVALTGVLESGLIRDAVMRRNISKRLRINAREIRYEEMLSSPQWMDRFHGWMGRASSNIANFIARRSFPKAKTDEVILKNRSTKNEFNHD
jgi:glycosyltransferase involved in cell wall biosynthesis